MLEIFRALCTIEHIKSSQPVGSRGARSQEVCGGEIRGCAPLSEDSVAFVGELRVVDELMAHKDERALDSFDVSLDVVKVLIGCHEIRGVGSDIISVLVNNTTDAVSLALGFCDITLEDVEVVLNGIVTLFECLVLFLDVVDSVSERLNGDHDIGGEVNTSRELGIAEEGLLGLVEESSVSNPGG